jgi:sucrose-phosphate synthase
MQMVDRLLERRSAQGRVNVESAWLHGHARGMPARSRLPTVDRFILCDIDNTLVGEAEGLQALLERLHAADSRVGFGIATGRRLESALKVLREWDVPLPDVLITSVGSEIHYGPRLVEDTGWQRHIEYRWKPQELREALAGLPGLRLQAREDQRRHKVSYYVDPAKAPSMREIRGHLRQRDLHANVIFSHDAYLDLLPIGASKGLALRYIGGKWGLSPDRFLVAGDSGNDSEMLCGNTLGVVVGNYSRELERLRGRPRIYFARGRCAWGVLEGLEHYDFFNAMRVMDEATEE